MFHAAVATNRQALAGPAQLVMTSRLRLAGFQTARRGFMRGGQRAMTGNVLLTVGIDRARTGCCGRSRTGFCSRGRRGGRLRLSNRQTKQQTQRKTLQD